MNRYSIETYSKEFPAVQLYTVRFNGNNVNETDAFITRFQGSEQYQKDFQTIIYWISKIGEKGALERHFRTEGYASAIPIEKGNLRLYAYRVSDEILILGNGGIKSSKRVQDSPDCYPHFQLMNHVSGKIHFSRKHKRISIVGRELRGNLQFIYSQKSS